MASLVRDALVGTAAGLAGAQAMGAVSNYIYARTDPAVIAREQALEPRAPMGVVAERLERRTGRQVDEDTHERLALGLEMALGIGMGVAYVTLSRRMGWNWLVGGVKFGALYWAVIDETVGPALGLTGDNRKYPLTSHLRGLAAHVAFGVAAAGVASLFSSKRER